MTQDAPLSFTVDLSSFLAGWIAAFGLGKVVTTQPDAVGNPTVYDHVFTFFDPLVTASKQPPVTTIYTELGSAANFKRKMRAMAIARFTISGNRREVLQASVEMAGSGERVVDAVTVGAPMALSYLDMNLTALIGTQGAPVDLSERLLSLSMSVDLDLQLDHGYHPGSGFYRGRLWIGSRRRAALSMRLWLKESSSDLLDYFGNETLLEAKFTSVGDTISTTYKPQIEIFYPSLRLGNVPIGEQDGMMIYDVESGEDLVYKDAGAGVVEPVRITVRNTEASYLVSG